MFRILATLLAAAVPMLAAAQETPDALVKRVSDEVVAIIKSDKDVQSGNTTKIVELAEQKVLPHFDFERMTRLAVGRNWAQAGEQRMDLGELRMKAIGAACLGLDRQELGLREVHARGHGAHRRDPAGRPADPDRLLDGEDG